MDTFLVVKGFYLNDFLWIPEPENDNDIEEFLQAHDVYEETGIKVMMPFIENGLKVAIPIIFVYVVFIWYFVF